MPKSFGWLDVRQIGEMLADAHPERDPLTIRFTELRSLVAGLPGFSPDPAHPVNEKILEAIQSHWNEEYLELKRDDEDD